MLARPIDSELDSKLQKLELDDLPDHIFLTFSKYKPRDTQNLGYLSRTSDVVRVSIPLSPDLISTLRNQGLTSDRPAVSQPTTRRRERRDRSHTPAEELSLDFEVHQSLQLFNSSVESSTTGAVVWQVSLLFAEWVLSPHSVFHGLFRKENCKIIEIGTGSSGILACALSLSFLTTQNSSACYIATDQAHILPILQKNVQQNIGVVQALASHLQRPRTGASYRSLTVSQAEEHSADYSSRRKKRSAKPELKEPQGGPRLEVLELDWENAEADVKYIRQVLESDDPFDVVIACDTVYNDFLIKPFVETLNRLATSQTHVLVALQMRSHEVHEAFLEEVLGARLDLWHVRPAHLSDAMRAGFAVYYIRKK